ncbi:hypothetical protein KAU09_00175 [Candidatus Parcubacteria bacterium]|nr:hypothetical protein [Candidatus Parcubacteria bacterium]
MEKSSASKYADSCRKQHTVYPILKCVICLMFVLLIISIGVKHILFFGELAEIEQLREDVEIILQNRQNVPAEIQTIIIKYNMRIKSHKQYNDMWLSDIFHHDGWNNVKLIKLSKQ